mgnify:CR=1 FL=1
MDYNILLWNNMSSLTKLVKFINDKKIENKNNKKNVNKIIIEENKINEENNINNNDNSDNSDKSDESNNNLLNIDKLTDIPHYSYDSGNANNNIFGSSYESFNGSEPINKMEIDNHSDKARSVFISKRGTKYHSGRICGRMKSSKEVDLNMAIHLGYTKCILCKFD